MADQWLQYAFGFAPWLIFAVIVLVAFLATRGHEKKPEPVGQTFACAGCGRRGSAGQMVAANRDGAETWYCPECSRSA